MKTQTVRRMVTPLLLLGVVVPLTGCQGGGEANKTAPLTIAEQVRLIQNDPKMPADAKALAIQQLQGQAGSIATPPRPPNQKH